MVVIVLIGTKYSGKKTVVNILKEQGFQHISLLAEFKKKENQLQAHDNLLCNSTQTMTCVVESSACSTADAQLNNHTIKQHNLPLTHLNIQAAAKSVSNYQTYEKTSLLTEEGSHILCDKVSKSNFIKTSMCLLIRARPYVVSLGVDAPLPLRYSRYYQTWTTQTNTSTELPFPSFTDFALWDAQINFGCDECQPFKELPNIGDVKLKENQLVCPKELPHNVSTPSNVLSPVEKNLKTTPNYFSFPGGVYHCIQEADFMLINNKDIAYLRAQITGLSLQSPEIFRPNYHTYFIQIALETAMRSNCIRRTVGAVITRNNKVIATGYNGSPTGCVNCLNGGCDRCLNNAATRGKDLHKCVCVHAEANALLQGGIDRCRGGTLYVTCFPCLSCAKLIVQAEIARLVYLEAYDNNLTTIDLFKQKNIDIVHYTPVPRKRTR